MEAERQIDREHRLRHDILQAAVDAGVEESLDKLWGVMTDSKARDDLDDLRPMASLLRNGFENAEGLDISIETVQTRVVIDVDDEVIARLNDDIEVSFDGEDNATTVNDEEADQ